jgi:mannosyl-oligosaccharide glucosidase
MRRRPPAAAARAPAGGRPGGGRERRRSPSARAIALVLAAGAAAALALRTTTPPYLRRLPGPRVASLQQFQGAWASRMHWGTYRSGAYLGLRTRAPRGLVAGLAWFDPDAGVDENNRLPIRHEAQERDGLRTFGWARHDGESFGVQALADGGALLTTSFVKREIRGVAGGDWGLRVEGGVDVAAVAARGAAAAAAAATGEPPPPPLASRVSLIFYVGDEAAAAGDGDGLTVGSGGLLASGADAATGAWALHLASPSPVRHVARDTRHLHNVTDWLQGELEGEEGGSRRRPRLRGALPNAADARASLAAFQITTEIPFSIDIVFTGGMAPPQAPPARWRAFWRAPPDPPVLPPPPSASGAPASPVDARVSALSGPALTTLIAAREASFDARFAATLAPRGGDAATASLSKAALSNLLGGMAYFHGAPLVKPAAPGKPPARGAAGPLFTATPARAFFPRGFLWDEGFHALVLMQWSPLLARDALAHWADAVTASGWLAREQILGPEAEARVPAEFVVQDPAGANPPTLLLPLAAMAARVEAAAPDDPDAADAAAFLRAAYPRVRAWVDWLLRTQKGAAPGSFRWRGRDGEAVGELNPKTLTSGLDDYPRASHPTPDERHVDLLCWAAVATRLLARVGARAGRPRAEVARYAALAAALGDPAHVRSLHWDDGAAGFFDYGLHTDGVELAWRYIFDADGIPVDRTLERSVTASPSLRHVSSHVGYVSLFPLLVRLLPADSRELAAALDQVRTLLCPAGLASLAPTSPLRDVRNTEHDAPYWRGAAWPPVAYMALSALDHYSNQPGPHALTARTLREELRANFVGNAVARAVEAGGVCDVWERYDGGDSGAGLGPRPFTGWGATLALAAAGAYFDM